jgi:hypothetical protein
MQEDRKVRTSATIGLPEKALIPSWNLGAILLTCFIVFHSLSDGKDPSDKYIKIITVLFIAMQSVVYL